MILRRIINNFYSQDVITQNDHIEFINKIIKTNNLYYLLNYYVKLRRSNLIDIVNTIIYGNHIKIVQILIDHKIKNYKIFLSCLLEAIIFKNKEEMLIMLLSNDVDCNFKINDNTLLHLACYSENYNICKILLKYGADINSKNDLHLTPIIIFFQQIFYNRVSKDIISKRCKLLKLLLMCGADINEELIIYEKNNFSYRTTILRSFCCDVQYYKYLDYIKIILNYSNPDLEKRNFNQLSILDQCCWLGHYEVIKLLIEFGAECDYKSLYKLNSLDYLIFSLMSNLRNYDRIKEYDTITWILNKLVNNSKNFNFIKYLNFKNINDKNDILLNYLKKFKLWALNQQILLMKSDENSTPLGHTLTDSKGDFGLYFRNEILSYLV